MIFILTGPVHSGKTTFLKKLIQKLEQGELKMDGFLSESRWKDREISGYDLMDLNEGKSHPFIRKTGEKNWDRVGPFYFLPETLALARQIIRRAQDADICVIDEVGPLELSGKGLWPALRASFSMAHSHHLLVIRISILEKVLHKINRKDIRVFHMEEKGSLGEILESLKPDRAGTRYS